MEISNKPIVIAGAHRSGTTWLANMLHFSGETTIVNEPFNIEKWSYQLNGLANYWYTYAPGLDQTLAIDAYSKIVNMEDRRLFPKSSKERWSSVFRTGRPVIKDPLSSMSLRWIKENFDVQIVVLIRHPGAFISSLKRKQWYFAFDNFLNQKKLMDDHLGIYEDEMRSINNKNIVENGALCWKCVNHVLKKTYGYDNSIIVVKHETLASNPVKSFQKLYKKLNLKWDTKVEIGIKKFTKSENPVNAPSDKTHYLKRDSISLIHKWKNTMSKNEIIIFEKITDNYLNIYSNIESQI